MNFSNVFVGVRPNHPKDISEKVLKVLKNLGAKTTSKPEPNTDLAILIGGDGTLLYNHSRLGCPILGIKDPLHVGYYMGASTRDFKTKLEKLIQGKQGKDFFIHEFLRLETRVNGKLLPDLALNEVFINPIYSRRMLNTEMTLSGVKSVERNSGIVVYTPAGSNAFAGSLGAKKLKPNESSFGVIPVATYSGRLKPTLMKRGEVVVKCRNMVAEVCIDGVENRAQQIKYNDTVSVRKSRDYARIVGFSKNF